MIKWTRGSKRFCKLVINLLEMCYAGGGWPWSFRKAIIRPLLKADGVSFRPVSMLTVLDKLVQRLVLERLKGQFVIDAGQYGSQRGLNAEMTLVALSERGREAMREGRHAALVCVDFRQAYDRCHRGVVWWKLVRAGVEIGLADMIFDFMSHRSFFVEIPEFYRVYRSPVFSQYSGVVQDSCMGPALWTVMLDDLVRALKYGDAELECPLEGIRRLAAGGPLEVRSREMRAGDETKETGAFVDDANQLVSSETWEGLEDRVTCDSTCVVIPVDGL